MLYNKQTQKKPKKTQNTKKNTKYKKLKSNYTRATYYKNTKKVIKTKKHKKKYKMKKSKLNYFQARFILLNCIMITSQAMIPSGWKPISTLNPDDSSDGMDGRYGNFSKQNTIPFNSCTKCTHWESIQWEGKMTTNLILWKHLLDDNWRLESNYESAKIRNRNVRSKNGNIVPKIKIIHWNVGGRLWCNKTEDVEALILQEKPHLLFISEANLWDSIEDEDRQIAGYSLILPNTMQSLGHARIVLLVRNDIHVSKINEYMDTETASIWVRIGQGKDNSIVVGGYYREHNQLGQQHLDATWMERRNLQENRWNVMINKWKLAASKPKMYINRRLEPGLSELANPRPDA